MAKLYISEYTTLGLIGSAQIAAVPPIATQVIDYSGGATPFTFNAATRFARFQNDSICSLRFDGSAATTSYPRSPADNVEYYGVQGGSSGSVISNT